MSIFNNKQFTEIYRASKNGNEKAKAIIDKYMQGGNPDEISRLIDEYYSPKTEPEPELEEEQEQSQPEEPDAPVDISGDLDKDMDGLIDEAKFDDMDFASFLKNKKRDTIRGKKNSDYFKAYDEEGRHNYLSKKEDEYGKSFDTKRRDIDRSFKDMDNSLSAYAQSVQDQPDDAIETDMGQADKAYDELVSLGEKSHSFGRSWDSDDMNEVTEKLMQLIQTYGKKNVLAAINILKGDNQAFRDHKVNSIDKAIKDYNGKLEGLLK